MIRQLYAALFAIATLRDEVRALSSEMTSIDESRFLSRLDFLQAAAVRLVDDCEQRRRVCSH